MVTTITVCAVILTLTHLVGLVLVLFTLAQMRRSAEAVEVLAYQAQDQVEKINEATTQINRFAGSVRSGWLKILTVGLGAAVDLATKATRKKTDERGHNG